MASPSPPTDVPMRAVCTAGKRNGNVQPEQFSVRPRATLELALPGRGRALRCLPCLAQAVPNNTPLPSLLHPRRARRTWRRWSRWCSS